MRNFLIIFMLVFASIAHAAEDKTWGSIASLDTGLQIHGRFNSFERYEGAGSLIVRFSRNGNLTFYIVGITDKECDAGYGQVAFFDTNWKLLRKENYVQKGGNGISAVGDLLCLLINKQKGQSL